MTLYPSQNIKPENWQPVGIKQLERNALTVVKSTENQSVIAGPGAGKTELLAQRANYLLRTGLTSHRRRILAISFKKDAASNLKQRVKERCHPDLAKNFDSMTFDAFSKSLLDRFRMGLPEEWRPTADYEISFPNYKDFLNECGQSSERPTYITQGHIISINIKSFEKNFILPAPYSEHKNIITPGEWAAQKYWHDALTRDRKSHLSFAMIAGLVQLLLKTNPKILKAIRLTYSHLFLDEFQDTTSAQYALLKTIFAKTNTIITAVGDRKQRIMEWAGALENAFENFKSDFQAQETPLLSNYRSNPELVKIQHILADALEEGSIKTISHAQTKISEDVCQIWNCETSDKETEKLISFIQETKEKYHLNLNDFVLLVRQNVDDYERELSPSFKKDGLSLRNEAKSIGNGKILLRDLLSEEASLFIIAILRLASQKRGAEYWSNCITLLISLYGLSSEEELEQREISKKLDIYIKKFQKSFPTPPSSPEESKNIVEDIFRFLGVHNLILTYPAYSQGDWFEKVKEGIISWLTISSENQKSWKNALDEYEGIHSIPLMTIHKSKGLEYHTVIFLGLDDDAWCYYQKDKFGENASFFVAFTRAKQQVIFTFRGKRIKTAPLYELLKKANVPEKNIA